MSNDLSLGMLPNYLFEFCAAFVFSIDCKKKKLIRPKTAPARSTRRVVRKKKSTGGLKKQSNSNNSNSNMKVTTTRMKRPQSAKPSSRVAIDVTADINNANLVQA